MSVLATASSDTVENVILNMARPIFAAAIWSWYAQHQGDVLFSKWFISIRVRDVRPLIEALAGPEDEAAVSIPPPFPRRAP